MKKLKFLALALAAVFVLALAACTAAPDNTSGGGTEGRYTETDITPPEAEGKNLKSFVTADGTLLCYSMGLQDRWESKDGGETWTHSPGPGATNPDLANVTDYTLLADGSLLVGLVGEKHEVQSLARVADDGTVTPFPLADLDEAVARGSIILMNLQALPGDRLLLGYTSGGFAETVDDGGEGQEGDNDGTMVFGSSDGMGESKTALYDLATGKEVADLTDWQGFSATADEENLYLLDFEGNLTARKLADGSPVAGVNGNLSQDEFSFNLALGGAKDGNLLACDGKKLLKSNGSGTPEVLFEGSSYAFGAPGRSVDSLLLAPDGSILVSLVGGDGTKLYKYTWDENATVDPAKTVKIWSLKDNSTLRAAINAFRQKHPDALVEYEVALDEEGMTAEDAIKNLNTRLVGGDGPDIILLDGLPMESFADKGVLADLSDLVDTGNMSENLVAPFKGDKGLCYLPLAMRIPVLMGNSGDMANNLQSLVEKMEQGQGRPVSDADTDDLFGALPQEERPVMGFEELREVFDILWNSGSPDIVKDDGLDSDNLRTLLSSLKAINDKYGFGEAGSSSQAMVSVATTGGDNTAIQGSPINYAMQRALMGAATLGDLMGLSYMVSPEGTELTSFPGLTEGAWMPIAIAGINADSAVKELAAELLQLGLSDEVQGSVSGSGLPVTETGLIRQIDNINKMMRESGMEEDLINYDLNPLIGSLKQPNLTETILTEAVWATAEKLCLGEVDLEGAISQIEKDVSTYLAERV